jgi:hypothetical protein
MENKNCGRAGCTHTRCIRHNPKFGYLCDECYDELIDYLFAVDAYIGENWELAGFVKAFLRHPKGFMIPKRNDVIRAVEKLADGVFPAPR